MRAGEHLVPIAQHQDVDDPHARTLSTLTRAPWPSDLRAVGEDGEETERRRCCHPSNIHGMARGALEPWRRNGVDGNGFDVDGSLVLMAEGQLMLRDGWRYTMVACSCVFESKSTYCVPT